jgi:hypothetical protein
VGIRKSQHSIRRRPQNPKHDVFELDGRPAAFVRLEPGKEERSSGVLVEPFEHRSPPPADLPADAS